MVASPKVLVLLYLRVGKCLISWFCLVGFGLQGSEQLALFALVGSRHGALGVLAENNLLLRSNEAGLTLATTLTPC